MAPCRLFLVLPGGHATNSAAEQALRYAVVNRKVWGGSCTWSGAQVQASLMSVIETCRQCGRSALDFLSQTFRGLRPHLERQTEPRWPR
jgi:transposase